MKVIDKDTLLRRLDREKKARVESELISEKKTLELYFANEKLQELAMRLADKEARTRAILEAIADAVIVTDEKDHIVMSNNAAHALFKYSPDEMQQKPISKIIAGVEGLKKKKPSTSEKGFTEYLDMIGIGKDNMKIPIELVVTHQCHRQKEIYTIYAIRDISVRKRNEQRIQTQYAVTLVLTENLELEETILKILKIICENLKLELGAVWNLDRANNVLRCVSIWHRGDLEVKEFEKITRETAFHKGIGLPGRVWEKRKPCWIGDVTKDPNFPRSPFASKAGLHNGFGFPISLEGEFTGVIEFFSQSKENFDGNLLQMLDGVSRQIGLFIERKHTQKRFSDLSKQLVTAARRAGMAEVATSVLHNIGNVLNSVNVSASFLKEKVHYSELSGLADLAKLFNNNDSQIAQLLISHPKGKDLQRYVSLLAESWQIEQAKILAETDSLISNIQTIKNIVTMQQSLSGSFGVSESVSISDLLEDAIAIVSNSFERSGISIQREYEEIAPIFVDRVKLLQILINLIRNAKDALNAADVVNKKIILRTKYDPNAGLLFVDIVDNGCGIKPENIPKLFTYGFTTKKEGHGFGLHISAVSAQEMGGELMATSEGPNKGSTFTLKIPAHFSNS